MNKFDIVQKILSETTSLNETLVGKVGKAFAPSNIALIKYWGKSNTELNIPNTDSLSVSLGNLGATTEVSILDKSQTCDLVYLNKKLIDPSSEFYYRIVSFLNLFRAKREFSGIFYQVNTTTNIPVAAGLASSACGFAALVLALNDLYEWKLSEKNLSILARLGSGSAARSLWQGFVYWQKGVAPDGIDSYAFKVADFWPEFNIGLIILSAQSKTISSRQAMLNTIKTSLLYKYAWNEQVAQDIAIMNVAIKDKDFDALGATAENNALAMHATILSAKPAICYSTPETIDVMHKIWQMRQKGINIYFTQDAGPNLKLLFLSKDKQHVLDNFPEILLPSAL